MPTQRYTPQGLADALASSRESDYIRITATWLSRVSDWTTQPAQTGDDAVDALVAAASGYAALRHGEPEPRWTAGKRLDHFWHPGGGSMFAWSFAHTPASFKIRGIVVDGDSLVSV